jgi:hypothetical protein
VKIEHRIHFTPTYLSTMDDYVIAERDALIHVLMEEVEHLRNVRPFYVKVEDGKLFVSLSPDYKILLCDYDAIDIHHCVLRLKTIEEFKKDIMANERQINVADMTDEEFIEYIYISYCVYRR